MENEVETAALDTAPDISPSSEPGHSDNSYKLDDNAFDSLMDDLFSDEPVAQDAPEEEEELPVSEEEVLESSEDDTPVEADDEELEAPEEDIDEVDDEEAVDSDEGEGVWDYEELKENLIPVTVGGERRQMTLDQIQRELGQVKAASKAQSEVKATIEELELQKQQLAQREELLNERQTATEKEKHLAAREERIQSLRQQLEKARQDNNYQALAYLNDAIGQESELLAQEKAHVEEVTAQVNQQNLEAQRMKLNEMGYGELLSDKQRMGLLNEYAVENLSPTAINMVKDDATLFAALEKARLYDKSRSDLKKNGKLKPSKAPKKASKVGAGKVTPQSQKKRSINPIDAIAKDLGFDI